MLKKTVGAGHDKASGGRRTEVPGDMVAERLKDQDSVLDVGTGNGLIASMFSRQNDELTVRGIDVFIRPETYIPVEHFDGKTMPAEDNAYDAVTFVDVLHHTEGGEHLVKEAARVAKNYIVIKDHLANSWWDKLVLRLMDWVGNAPHGVVLPYNYNSSAEWERWFEFANLEVVEYTEDVPLYKWPLNLVFGNRLHFIGVFRPKATPPAA